MQGAGSDGALVVGCGFEDEGGRFEGLAVNSVDGLGWLVVVGDEGLEFLPREVDLQ